MSRVRRSFTPEFKSKPLLHVISGECDINSIAIANKIQPNPLRK